MKIRNPYAKKLQEATIKGNVSEIAKLRQLWTEYNTNWLLKNQGSVKKISRDLRMLHREKDNKEFKRSKRKIYGEAIILYRKAEEVMKKVRQFKKELRENDA